MSVKIRLMGPDPQEIAAADAAIRTVLDVPAPAADYGSRRRPRPGEPPDPTVRRYLESTGVRATAPAAAERQASPLDVATDAKRSRDLLGEIDALQDADRDLTARPWYPLQPGDIVLMHLPGDARVPDYGQTFLAVDDAARTDVAGNPELREISRTRLDGLDDTSAPELTPFYDLWFEAGPARLVVIRAGAVVHGTPARAAVPAPSTGGRRA